MHTSTLSRSAERLVRQLHENTYEQQAVTVEDVIPIMNALQHIFPQWGMITCFVKHPDIRFVSANCEQLFGYPLSVLGRFSAMDFCNYIHEDDREEVNQCFTFMHDFFQDKGPDDYLTLRIVTQYRFRRNDGEVIFLHDEKAALQMPNQRYVYYSLFRDITQEQPFSGVKLEVIDTRSMQTIVEYRPAMQNRRLSKRETELVGLIRIGLTTKEIAHRLNISHHTVRNIRQKMFEKFNVNNSIELLNKALA
jgi:DNA-binding CsgD family transcriptional regulator